MIKHIVFWKFKEVDAKTKQSYANEVKQRLEALSGRIPELLAIEVGINYNATSNAADIALYTEFATEADLQAYQEHPEHMVLVPFIGSITDERRVVDYAH
jgi:hypothetical protein